jgi:serine protease Do
MHIRLLLVVFMALLFTQSASADPGDISAASRSVVRVVVFPASDPLAAPIGHGSGVVVSSNAIVTNNHVVDENQYGEAIRVVIVPGDGKQTYEADVADMSPRNDLALIRLRNGARLTPVGLYSGPIADGLDVFAIGYPGGVDIAQGLNTEDILQPQPAVKTRGSISAGRSAKEFETLLHTAPIGGGNSGGPLVDGCGRVVGINSFGTVANGNDAEFFFAIAVPEVSTFLRKNAITPRMVSGPCLSAAELSRAEESREAQVRAKIQAENLDRENAKTLTLGQARRQAEYAIITSRENRMMMTVILLLFGLGAGGACWQLLEREKRDGAKLACGGAAALLIAALMTYATRPGFDEVDARIKDVLKEDTSPAARAVVAKAGKKTCTIDRSRSRITVSDTADVTFDWSAQGCVNARTQYAEDAGKWARTFAPGTEQQVSIVSFEPDSGSYRIERHLLGADAMGKAREARNRYDVKGCSSDPEMLDKIGQMNRAVRELLPTQANEVLQFNCSGS